MNDLISIVQCDDTFVVDSRLIAERLGVGRGDWYRNIILKCQTETEQAFGILRFQNGEVKGRGQPEKYCLLTEIPDSTIPDISIGLCWAKHLRREENIEPNEIAVVYPHQYPDGRKIEANSYPEEMLPKFRKWFRETYKPTKLPNYLGGKDRDALPTLSKMLGIPLAALK